MKKSLSIIFSLIFITLMLGCSNISNVDFNEYGRYSFDSCVYLSSLSSSTISSKTQEYQNIYQVDFSLNNFLLLKMEEEIFNYDNLEYRNVEMSDKINNIINIDIDELLKNFSSRYDIYSNNEYTEYSIFLNETSVYFARIIIAGVDNDLVVWDVFEISKQI